MKKTKQKLVKPAKRVPPKATKPVAAKRTATAVAVDTGVSIVKRKIQTGAAAVLANSGIERLFSPVKPTPTRRPEKLPIKFSRPILFLAGAVLVFGLALDAYIHGDHFESEPSSSTATYSGYEPALSRVSPAASVQSSGPSEKIRGKAPVKRQSHRAIIPSKHHPVVKAANSGKKLAQKADRKSTRSPRDAKPGQKMVATAR